MHLPTAVRRGLLLPTLLFQTHRKKLIPTVQNLCRRFARSNVPHSPVECLRRFCWNNWTVPIRAALPDVVHLPIIQLLGNSAPSHFKSPQLFARLYTEWAVKYSFDGFLLDAEVRTMRGCIVCLP